MKIEVQTRPNQREYAIDLVDCLRQLVLYSGPSRGPWHNDKCKHTEHVLIFLMSCAIVVLIINEYLLVYYM